MQTMRRSPIPSFHLNMGNRQWNPDNAPIHENSCDLIIPYLYVGSESAVWDDYLLDRLGITHVVSLGSELGSNPKRSTLKINLNDTAFDEFSEEFWGAIWHVRNVLNLGGSVLMHCRKGYSRSPALCVAYLMNVERMSFNAALDLVKAKRPVVSLNPGFIQQLKTWEMANTGERRSCE
jgi:hypothetical protein